MRIPLALAVIGSTAACSHADLVLYSAAFSPVGPLEFSVEQPDGSIIVGQQFDITADASNQPEPGVEIAHGVSLVQREFAPGGTEIWWTSSPLSEVSQADVASQTPLGPVFGLGSLSGLQLVLPVDWTDQIPVRLDSPSLGSFFIRPYSGIRTPVRFTIDGQTHFGYIELNQTVNIHNAPEFTITHWGYESEPDTPFTLPDCTVAAFLDDGVFNIYDLFVYLTMYNSNDPGADLAEPFGTLNFFDMAAFMTMFHFGCP